MTRLATAIAITSASLVLAGCATEPPSAVRPPAPAVRLVGEHVSYATGRVLDVYLPNLPIGRPPVVVLLHGCCGDRSDLAKLAEATAAAGVAVLNADWSGLDADGRFPRSYEEVACAVRFARSRTASYGVDARRVALVGWSDGALAAAVVARAGDRFARDRCVARDASALPDAFVGVAGFYGWTLPVDPRYVTDRGVRFLGGTPEQRPGSWREASAFTWVGLRPALPSVLLVGATDPLRVDAARFHAALRRAHARSRLIVAPRAGDQSMISARTAEGRAVVREAVAMARGATRTSRADPRSGTAGG